MGNPTSYLGKTLTWEGKQLEQVDKIIGDQLIRYSFAYDENGLRTKKQIFSSDTGTTQTVNYCYNGSVLIGMSRGSIVMRFSYDASGSVVAVDYSTNNGSSFTTYYYVRNAQNDIVKLIDSSGNTVVEYTYDSWGKLIATTGSLANTVGANQPFRYRGYVYDEETGWYYLQSRYYDPTTCRFISADVLLSTGQGILGHNAFAYCLNNPICFIDNGGNWPSYWSLKSDWAGRKILWHYLFGKGEDFIKEYDDSWTNYMNDNAMLTEKIEDIIYGEASSLESGQTKTISITTSMVIQNGEDIIGYQYLHGTDASVGGFQIEGTVTCNKDGGLDYVLTCTWNDMINPEYSYESDTAKAAFAELIANPKDYYIRIKWNKTGCIKKTGAEQSSVFSGRGFGTRISTRRSRRGFRSRTIQ